MRGPATGYMVLFFGGDSPQEVHVEVSAAVGEDDSIVTLFDLTGHSLGTLTVPTVQLRPPPRGVLDHPVHL